MLLLGILGGGVTSGSPNPDRPKNGIFHTRFQTWPLDKSYVIITEIRAQTKKFFKCISNSHISISFLFIWNRKDNYVHTLPIVPPKTITDSRPKWAKCTPVFRPKRPKALPFGAAQTYMAHIRDRLRELMK